MSHDEIQVTLRLTELYWVATLATLAKAAHNSGQLTPVIRKALGAALGAGASASLAKVHLILQESGQ